jgi:hypothetical protein
VDSLFALAQTRDKFGETGTMIQKRQGEKAFFKQGADRLT